MIMAWFSSKAKVLMAAAATALEIEQCSQSVRMFQLVPIHGYVDSDRASSQLLSGICSFVVIVHGVRIIVVCIVFSEIPAMMGGRGFGHVIPHCQTGAAMADAAQMGPTKCSVHRPCGCCNLLRHISCYVELCPASSRLLSGICSLCCHGAWISHSLSCMI